MNETTIRNYAIQCSDQKVKVTYAAGMIMVHLPKTIVCQGYNVEFEFNGRPGTADITPKNSSDTWLEKLNISIPTPQNQPVIVDTSQGTAGQPYSYTITVTSDDDEGNPVVITVDPIIRLV